MAKYSYVNFVKYSVPTIWFLVINYYVLMLMIFKKNKRLLKDNFNAINGININLMVSIYIQRKKVFPLRDVGNILFSSSVLYSCRWKMFNSS